MSTRIAYPPPRSSDPDVPPRWPGTGRRGLSRPLCFPPDFRGRDGLPRPAWLRSGIAGRCFRLRRGGPLPGRPVVLTVDDGFASDVSVVRPILERLRWTATLDLVLSHYGHRWGLTHRSLRKLIRAGWEIASHSRTHPYLPGLSDRALKAEVAGSRRFLQKHFHIPVSFFAYPSGGYDARVVAAVRRAGYRGALTTEEGLARRDEPYRLDRICVAGSDDARSLGEKLARLLPRAHRRTRVSCV